ncbi:hypothetical protein EX30DRAFT_38239 [Ascodesmis nigricans]|uniref:Uncharacterized protein n=1 Tax=Ascodesmis nigricans TaxID=341454 RepID=A0A4S2MWT7_9PEZI|nr:hypothetical protein EX30DRAFT_38239 [Ascodesmis nigricans]
MTLRRLDQWETGYDNLSNCTRLFPRQNLYSDATITRHDPVPTTTSAVVLVSTFMTWALVFNPSIYLNIFGSPLCIQEHECVQSHQHHKIFRTSEEALCDGAYGLI